MIQPFWNRFKVFVDVIVAALESGNKILFVATGGSAADAQHFIRQNLLVDFIKIGSLCLLMHSIVIRHIWTAGQ